MKINPLSCLRLSENQKNILRLTAVDGLWLAYLGVVATCAYFLANNLMNGQGMNSVNIGLTSGIILSGLLIGLSLFASCTNTNHEKDLGEKIVNNIAVSVFGFGVMSIQGFKPGFKKHYTSYTNSEIK